MLIIVSWKHLSRERPLNGYNDILPNDVNLVDSSTTVEKSYSISLTVQII
jgi:hypothetical protein